MKNTNGNASISIKELELPEGGMITINGVIITHKVINEIAMLGNSIVDLDDIKTNLAKNTMRISANNDKDNTCIVERNFFSYISCFYDISEALQEAIKEGGAE